jgi:flagellar hook-associated protein 2
MATDYLSALNAGSGLNTTEIIDSIVEAERAPRANIIESAKEERTVAISSLGQVKTTFESFDTELGKIDGKTGLSTTQVGTSVALEITDAAKAQAFSNNITVTSLAAAHTLAFNNSYSSETNAIGTGTLTFSFGTWDASNNFTANSDRTSSTITVNSSNNTLAGLRDAINSASMDVTASILKTGTSSYSLMVKSKEGASHAMRIIAAPDPSDSGLGNLGYAAVDTNIRTVDAANATLALDGVNISRESNTITDLVDGMTLTLKSTTSSTETIGASYDETAATATMQTFVDQLSGLGKSLDDMSKRGSNGSESGPLAGDPLIRKIRAQLRSYTTNPIAGFGASTYYLAEFGVKTNQDGTLTLDTTAFKAKYAADPDGFAAIINSRASADSGMVSASVTGSSYTPGTYAFDIDDSGNATLAGTAMTASGSSYTLSSGDAAGARVDIIGSGADTNIHLGRSLLESLSTLSTNLLKSNGELETKLQLYNNDLTTYADRLADLETKIAASRARYVSQFTAMEQATAALKRTSDSLDNMMEAWKASLSQ